MYRLRIINVVVVIFTVLLLSACLTSKQVKDIVEESNSAIIVASMSGQGEIMEVGPSAPKTDSWQKEVEKIEKFIANNPDQVATNNALRIREAVLLLNVGQANLASAVFAEVQCVDLGNSRDRAICDAQKPLIWWYGLGTTVSEEQREIGKEQIKVLATVANGLERTSPTRRMFEQIRVRAAIRLAESLSDLDEINELLSEALARYGKQFNQDDQKLIQDWGMNSNLPVSALSSLRWFNYVPAVYKQADDINDALCGSQCADFTPAWVSCIKDKSCP
ncbi:hypothetical protein [Kaarinaea lacus]